MPDFSLSSLHVVSNIPSMLFSYLFTTTWPLPLLCPHLYSVVGHISLIVPSLSGEFSAHSYGSSHLACLEVTKGLGVNGRKFRCNVSTTQRIGIFPLPPSH